jgi:hypothetical protein
MKKATIIIKDEVNAKIEGLDLDVRKALLKKFEVEKPGAKYLPSVRLGRWNGKITYFSLGGSTYINLLDQILPIIDRYDYDIELKDLREYNTVFEFDIVDTETFKNKNWPKGHLMEGQPIVLRDYQIEIVNNFLSNPQSIVESATGSGKTLITAALSKSVEPYGRSIIIVPNKSLVVQTEEDYVNLGLDVGVYFGDRKDLNKTHTICTWQSLNNLLKNTQTGDTDFTIQDMIEGVVCVIVDECFHPDSKVLTPNGYVPIKDINPGDIVINYSEKDKVFKEDVVVKRHKNLTKSDSEKMYELEFDNGVQIKVTGNHKFLTNVGWVRADELTEEHEIINTGINTFS